MAEGDARSVAAAVGEGVDAALRHPAVPPGAVSSLVASLRVLAGVVGRRAGTGGALQAVLDDLWRVATERVLPCVTGADREFRRAAALGAAVGAIADEAAAGGGGAPAARAIARVVDAAARTLVDDAAEAGVRARALDALVLAVGGARAGVWGACAGVPGFSGAGVLTRLLAALPAVCRELRAPSVLPGVFGVGCALVRSAACAERGATWDALVQSALAVGGMEPLLVLCRTASGEGGLRPHAAVDAAVVAAASAPGGAARRAACALAAIPGAVGGGAVAALCSALTDACGRGGCACAVAADVLLVLNAVAATEPQFAPVRGRAVAVLFDALCLSCASESASAAWAGYCALLVAMPPEERQACFASMIRACGAAYNVAVGCASEASAEMCVRARRRCGGARVPGGGAVKSRVVLMCVCCCCHARRGARRCAAFARVGARVLRLPLSVADPAPFGCLPFGRWDAWWGGGGVDPLRAAAAVWALVEECGADAVAAAVDPLGPPECASSAWLFCALMLAGGAGTPGWAHLVLGATCGRLWCARARLDACTHRTPRPPVWHGCASERTRAQVPRLRGGGGGGGARGGARARAPGHGDPTGPRGRGAPGGRRRGAGRGARRAAGGGRARRRAAARHARAHGRRRGGAPGGGRAAVPRRRRRAARRARRAWRRRGAVRVRGLRAARGPAGARGARARGSCRPGAPRRRRRRRAARGRRARARGRRARGCAGGCGAARAVRPPMRRRRARRGRRWRCVRAGAPGGRRVRVAPRCRVGALLACRCHRRLVRGLPHAQRQRRRGCGGIGPPGAGRGGCCATGASCVACCCCFSCSCGRCVRAGAGCRRGRAGGACCACASRAGAPARGCRERRVVGRGARNRAGAGAVHGSCAWRCARTGGARASR